jgi:hypothetical protein
MNNPHDRYLSAAYGSPKSSYQSPTLPTIASPPTMARASSFDKRRTLGYFDIPTRSAPSSPQASSLPYTPISRSSSPAREARLSRELNHSHSGSDFEDALVGFSLVPNWLKLAMEQGQHPTSMPRRSTPHRDGNRPMPSPSSTESTSNVTTPLTPRVPQLNITIPSDKILLPSPQMQDKFAAAKSHREGDEDRRYWEEEDEGYWAEMDEEQQEEDWEEAYRSVI